MSDFKKRNIIIGALCGVLLLMVIGYAAFSTSLNINGTANITSNWDIEITDIKEKTKIGGASTVEGYPTHNTLTATFQTNLVSPGDSIEYEVTVENRGDIDGVLKKVTLSDSNNPAIKFTTIGLLEGELLNSGKSKVFTVKVEYDSNVTSQPESKTSELTVTLEYTQKNVDEDNIAHPQLTKVNMKGVDVPIVTENDGLYEDEYEIGRYVYKGAEPNNYITFNGETAGWRIIAIEADGTIKIMRNNYVTKMSFDSIGHRDDGYCSLDWLLKNGCNAWAKTDNFEFFGEDQEADGGLVEEDSEIKTYLNETYYNTINDDEENIQEHDFYFGLIKSQIYETNFAEQIAKEKHISAKSNIGLIQASDYIKANTNTTQCGTMEDNNAHTTICKKTNWMFADWQINDDMCYYTLTPKHDGILKAWPQIYVVSGIGRVGYVPAGRTDPLYYVRPVIYLKSTIKLSGSGTKEEPYSIL